MLFNMIYTTKVLMTHIRSFNISEEAYFEHLSATTSFVSTFLLILSFLALWLVSEGIEPWELILFRLFKHRLWPLRFIKTAHATRLLTS